MKTKENKIDCGKKLLLLAYLIGLVTQLFSAGRWNIPVFAWIWPACLLWFYRKGERRGVIVGSIVMMLLQTLHYWGYSDGGLIADAVMGMYIGIPTLAVLLLDRWIYPRLRRGIGAWSVLFAPAAYVAIVSSMDLINSMPQIGYAMSGNLPIMQVCAIVGVYGLSFLLMLFATVLLYALEQPKEQRCCRPVKIYAIILLAIFVLGGVRVGLSETRGDSVLRMAYGLTNYQGDFSGEDGYAPDVDNCIEFLRDKAEQAAGGGAELLTLAEEAFEMDDADEPKLLEAACRMAVENDLWMLVPVDECDTDGDTDGRNENKEFLIDPQGNIVTTYYKVNLVPGDMEANCYVQSDNPPLYAEIPTRAGATAHLSSVICYDADNSRFVASMDDRTDVLIVPAWCWDGSDTFQSLVMPFRAIENNVALTSVTVDAKSVSSDWMGSIIATSDEETLGRDGLNFVNVPIRERSVRAPYHFYATALSWLYPLVTLLLIVLAFRKKKEE